MFRRLQRAVLPIVIVVAVAGCGPRQQPAQAPPPAEGEVTEVQVTLSDFKVEPSRIEFVTGTRYRFVVTNRGAVNHEFMIAPPMMGGMTMEKMHEMAVLEIEEDELPPGTTKTIEYVFREPTAEGKLEFACHVEGHYEAGMHLPIVVK